MVHKKIVYRAGESVGWLFALKSAAALKMTFILGSTAAFFSGISILAPLVGSCSSLPLCTVIFALRVLIHGIWTGSFSWAGLAFYVPGWCAAFSWHRPSFLTKVALPLLCMVLFVVHPAGSGAWIYSLYWLIPMAIYAIGYSSIFAHALSATFIAHAVGSVIWQYTMPMTSAAWLLLIPVVFFERILFASAMTLLYYVGAYSRTLYYSVRHKYASAYPRVSRNA